MIRDLKYLAAFTIPITAVIGLCFKGYYAYLTPLYAFGFIPVVEMLTTKSKANLDDKTRAEQSTKKIFDYLLYLNVPIVYGLLFFFLYTVTTQTLTPSEYVGLLFSIGIVIGADGINVAHELGHRYTWERYLGKALLLPALYMHFFIEHNYGHHLHVATNEDPATAKYNRPVYWFWVTSVFGQYASAWKIQLELLKKQKRSFFSTHNDMLWYLLITLLYLSCITLAFGTLGLQTAVLSGAIGFLLLETINYVEHYGLLRKKTASGRYERVREIHSWNSNHVLGRIVLYELTRHSDHHHRASKKYQLLDHHDSSPQLPLGYPASMLLSLLPPLWFMVMNKRIPKTMKDQAPV